MMDGSTVASINLHKVIIDNTSMGLIFFPFWNIILVSMTTQKFRSITCESKIT